MSFDRQATRLGLSLYQDLRAKLQSSEVAYGDETTWREDGKGRYVWYGGNDDVAVYLITDNRSSQSAAELLGEAFDGTLITDDYAAYNAVGAQEPPDLLEPHPHDRQGGCPADRADRAERGKGRNPLK